MDSLNLNLKSALTLPYNVSLRLLSFLEDKISSQPRPETFDNVKIKDEMKEERMNFEELVMSRGYPLEIHYTETEDGYILKLYRIPGGKAEKNYRKKQKQSVFLMHGIFDSSDGWVCNSEDKCIPFILANLGYDIWLGNTRGNKHSRHHKKYKDDSPEMWNFSFNEMGLYDLPSFLNHVTKINTWSKQIIYIGHSQGTAQLFAGLTQNFEYFREKIKLFIALGPVARVCNMNNKIMQVMRTLKVDKLLENLAFHEVLSEDSKLNKVSSWLTPKIPFLCSFVANNLGDMDSNKYNNKKMMSVYLSHQPGGGSLKAISHFVQLSRGPFFRKFDYGKELNKVIYNSETPPDYDLSLIHDFPIALFSGLEDRLASPKDVEWLTQQLGENVVLSKKYPGMGHTTFQMAEDMSWFDDVTQLMDLYL